MGSSPHSRKQQMREGFQALRRMQTAKEVAGGCQNLRGLLRYCKDPVRGKRGCGLKRWGRESLHQEPTPTAILVQLPELAYNSPDLVPDRAVLYRDGCQTIIHSLVAGQSTHSAYDPILNTLTPCL
jgi:hypothetical protein